jgi:hypothetical protein
LRAKRGPDPDAGLEVFGVDPGGTTGWATIWIPTANVILRDVDIFDDAEYDCGQWTGTEGWQSQEFRFAMKEFRGPVLCEDFILRKFRQDADLLAPVRMTARIEQQIWEVNTARMTGGLYTDPGWEVEADRKFAIDRGSWDGIRFKKQQPSLAKSTATDDRLKKWGMYEKGQPHARDAVRQCATFLRRAKTDRRLLLWGWPWLRDLIK